MRKIKDQDLYAYLLNLSKMDSFLQGLLGLMELVDEDTKQEIFDVLENLIIEAKTDEERKKLILVQQEIVRLQELEREQRLKELTDLHRLESDFENL